MTTERALPTPPVRSPSPTKSSKFSFPSPNKPDPNLKPNPHPYAVKTTTSALLTRSNSSGHNIDTTRHYYVPLSPNASRSPESAKGGHKTSKSLTAVAESPSRSPRPLPAPPTASGNNSPVHSADASLADASSFPRRTKRAETLPTFPSEQPAPGLELLAIPDDLPPNPKLWTPAQLSTYLKTALRVTSQARVGQPGAVPLPIRVAKDIAAFARSRMITGRMFLRLTEADLESMGMNKKWRELLLATSQELRQNVLKGRIWGEGVSPTPSPGSTSPLPNMFSNAFYASASNSSASSLDLSADEGAHAPPPPERPRRSRNGRVRGMVQSFERSGSFSSEASFDGEEAAEGMRAELGKWLREEGGSVVEEQPIIKSPNASPTRRPLPDPFAPSQQRYAAPPPPPPVNGEPTMEELLAAEPASAWGARAWEEMDGGPGVTVKRVNGVPHPLPPVPTEAEVEANTTGTVVGHGREASSGRRKERDERRIVTAIFTPSVPMDDATPEEQEEVARNGSSAESHGDAVKMEELAQGGKVQTEVEETRRLSEELEATRALVDVFRRRLEDVEAKVAELERVEVERQQLEREQREREREAAAREQAERERQEREQQEREQQLAAERAAQEAEPVEELVTPGVRADLQASGAEGKEDAAGPSTLLARTAAMIPAALHHLENVGSLNRTHQSDGDGDDGGEPSNLSDLPSYVLLVGFGVCAVVLRVVMRRVAGRNAIVPWRP